MTERFNKLEELRKAGVSDTEILNALVCAMSDAEFTYNIHLACKQIEYLKRHKAKGLL